jgi:hypothetical protein
MSKKPAIPPYSSADKTLTIALAAMKENIELMTGARPGSTQILPLGTAASTSAIIAKINEIVAKLNYSGE